MSAVKTGLGCCCGTVVGGVLGVVVLIAFFFSVASRVAKPKVAENRAIPATEPIPAPAVAPANAASPDPDPKPANEPPKPPKDISTISGVTVAKLTEPFIARGFGRRHSAGVDDGTGVLTPDIWELDQKTPYADCRLLVFAYSDSQIESVQASATTRHNGGDFPAEAAGYFKMLALTPYNGADPDAARKWLEQNISKNVASQIGSTKFELTGTEFVRTLTITPRR